MIILLFPLYLFSQKKTCSCAFRSIATVGTVAGESGVRPLLLLNGGITYGRYFSGIGTGFDSYRFNSIPVFADWRVNFGKNKTVFIYGNGGYNFPAGHSDKEINSFKTSDRMTGGLYMDAGFGYRVPLGGLHGISFSAGYSQKNIKWIKGYTYPCVSPPCVEEFYKYSYQFGRFVTKLSWELDWRK